jgi:hypothetical protein
MQVTAAALASARRLLAIGCFCIGTNQVDLEVCASPCQAQASCHSWALGGDHRLAIGVPAQGLGPN